MGWMETEPLSERLRFIASWLTGEEPVTALAIRFGVSRKTAHKWIARYRESGPSGLHDRSRAPKQPSRQIAPEIAEQVIALRHQHPAWGPRKLRARLVLDAPDVRWPAASTIGDLLKREGLVRPRKRRHRSPPQSHPFAEAAQPNDVWCLDFKGHWRTGDGARIEPFTVSDAMSRYLLVCQAVPHTDITRVWPILVRTFKEYGLPRAIRSDNGPPFASVGAGGLSRLSVAFIKMGIVPERIAPGKPQQNGRHERMHQTLKREAATPVSRTAGAQKRRLARFQTVFNHERPHEALGQIPPAYLYAKSPRLWDGKLRSPDYLTADHIRQVKNRGTIKFKGHEIFLAQALHREPVGLFAVQEDIYQVHYGPILLGHIDRYCRFHKLKAKRKT